MLKKDWYGLGDKVGREFREVLIWGFKPDEFEKT